MLPDHNDLFYFSTVPMYVENLSSDDIDQEISDRYFTTLAERGMEPPIGNKAENVKQLQMSINSASGGAATRRSVKLAPVLAQQQNTIGDLAEKMDQISVSQQKLVQRIALLEKTSQNVEQSNSKLMDTENREKNDEKRQKQQEEQQQPEVLWFMKWAFFWFFVSWLILNIILACAYKKFHLILHFCILLTSLLLSECANNGSWVRLSRLAYCIVTFFSVMWFLQLFRLYPLEELYFNALETFVENIEFSKLPPYLYLFMFLFCTQYNSIVWHSVVRAWNNTRVFSAF